MRSFLSAFGATSLFEAAWILPKDFLDLRHPLPAGDIGRLSDGEAAVLSGVSSRQPVVDGKGARRRVTAEIADQAGRSVRLTGFGDPDEWVGRLQPGRRILAIGKVNIWNGRYSLNLKHVFSDKWAGKVRPVYPSRQAKDAAIDADSVYDYQRLAIPKALAPAAEWIRRRLAPLGDERAILEAIGLPPERIGLEKIIRYAHFPNTPADGARAHQALDRLAALMVAVDAVRDHQRTGIVRQIRISSSNLARRAGQLPFSMTLEQRQAATEIARNLASSAPMHHLLSGDVGTGKTAVFGVVVAAAVDAGAHVAVMLPRGTLAEQVHREILQAHPDLADKTRLVTAENKTRGESLADVPLLVGTHALLHRNIGERDLVVVDEQQKFSIAQREALVSRGGHLLEASATCVPRSMALIQNGVISVSELRQPHTPKTIHTRIIDKDGKALLKRGVSESLSRGGQVLVVYPLKEGERKARKKGEEAMTDNAIRSVEKAFASWEKARPGQVRMVHGGMSDEEKSQALADLREGKANILLSTTVVEVGINLPRLRRVVVVDPHLLGLNVLHQIRGRAARQGGEGWCDLYVTETIDHEARERLKVLEQTQSGFEVAERDIELRGFGDIDRKGDRQHGNTESFLYKRPLSVPAMIRAAKVVRDRELDFDDDPEAVMAAGEADAPRQAALAFS